MGRKVHIGASEPHMWTKLAAVEAIDPAASGGITEVVLARRRIERTESLGPLFETGYDEIHQIEPGFAAHITDAVIDHDWRLTAKGLEASVRFRIAFAGEADYETSGNRLLAKNAKCSYIIRPAGESLTAHFRGGETYRYCSLNLARNYLLNTLALQTDDLPPMLISHWDQRETVMGHFDVSKTTLTLAGRLFHLKSENAWRDVEIRALALDLLRTVFEDWRHASARSRTDIRLSPTESDTLRRIRDRIDVDPLNTSTIAALSSQFKINRNKLHFGFKRMFGVSIHEYQTELRMRMAHSMLTNTDMPIADVAEQVGYSEPTNFTAAFKKHFGLLPRMIRGSRIA